MRIVFMGTPEFAVESLKILVENKYDIVGVITTPDKPAGRGQKISKSAVKEYAEKNNLNILQPEKLKNQDFLNELKNLKPDLQIVVAFRMLPEEIWSLPQYGTFNLHASLLPDYRGAAPINWAVINGEKETGVTTFFIEKDIDTGKVIFQEKIPIGIEEDAGNIHDKLMKIGSELVLKTVQNIEKRTITQTLQSDLIQEGHVLKVAPKIFKETCQISWTKESETIYNFIRGLSPYPTAWCELISLDSNEKTTMKIYKSSFEKTKHSHCQGTMFTDEKTFIKIATTDGYISLLSIQLAGKKRLTTEEFLRGFAIKKWKFL